MAGGRSDGRQAQGASRVVILDRGRSDEVLRSVEDLVAGGAEVLESGGGAVAWKGAAQTSRWILREVSCAEGNLPANDQRGLTPIYTYSLQPLLHVYFVNMLLKIVQPPSLLLCLAPS